MAFCQIHHWKRLAEWEGSCVLLSRHPRTRTAVVFVHGFFGHAIDTWANFHTEIDQVSDGLSWWATSDLYFFQYPSAEDSMNRSAVELLQFLRTYLPAPPESLFLPDTELAADFRARINDLPLPLRSTGASYEELVLVGHSQGAVVIRQSVLDAVVTAGRMSPRPQFYKLLFDAKLCLFSPAHTGARLSGFAGLLTQIPLVRLPFDWILRNFSPSYEQLKINSAFLTNLSTRTTEAWEEHRFNVLRADITWGANDRVVNDLRFDHDADVTYEPDQTHTSVCKPRCNYREPMNFIRDAKTRQAARV